MLVQRLMLAGGLLVLWNTSLVGVAGAQQPPRTIAGVVTDTSGTPLDSVEVFLLSAKRQALSDRDGRFRFDNVKPGTYELSARHLGFFPQTRKIKVGDAGAGVEFRLVRRAVGLPAVVTTASRPGLSGVIGDTAYNIVSGAEVTVVASNHRAHSDSTGAFYLDVKPGTYMVHVSRPGYTSQMMSVTVPSDSGRRIVVWLTPGDRGANARIAAAMDSLSSRLLRKNAVWDRVLSREDIEKTGIKESSQLATVGAGKRIDERCWAIVDGGPQKTPLWTLRPEELEMMEVYATPVRGPSNNQVVSRVFGRGGVDRRGVQPDTLSSSDCGARIYVWLRK